MVQALMLFVRTVIITEKPHVYLMLNSDFSTQLIIIAINFLNQDQPSGNLCEAEGGNREFVSK